MATVGRLPLETHRCSVTNKRGSTPLRVIAEALRNASFHGDNSSIVPISPLVLHLWGEQLEEIENRARGAPGKSLLHANWAVRYWHWRATAPEDIKGAIRDAQDFTRELYPWEQVPTAATVKRVARKHRAAVFATFRGNLKPLLAYLEEHEKQGRD